MDIKAGKDIVILAGKELVKRGLIARTWGNVSQRLNQKTMLITPSGRDYLSLRQEDIVAVDIETLEYTGDVKPSSEKAVHASCYKLKNAGFVIHTHQTYASVISACEIDGFDCDLENYPLLGGRVEVASYGLPGTKKLNAGVEAALKKTKGQAVVMKHHGALCFGSNYEETFEAATQLEAASKAYIEETYKMVSGESQADAMAIAKYVVALNGNIVAEAKTGSTLPETKEANIVINASDDVVALSHMKKPLRPMVDDFAQIVGVKMKAVSNFSEKLAEQLKDSGAVFVKGVGAVCAGPTMDDAEAVSMIVEKNAKAYVGARLHGKVKPINRFESRLMRIVYQMKYSKQINNK